ncbi:hypothetical protein KM691_gp3 [Garba virus]|uniref:Uncharacterized protein n=1 Tax=Garba virus TaxID=864696 RepID=A0A0D3R1E5_9RHAB|nr:hypothetical protein KM691_gp3 [Garba virus]AJR28275.1 hypothetical protein [Garba virus]
MSHHSVETIVRILEECTDLECQEHPQEVHFFNLFRWGKFMIQELLRKVKSLCHGIQMKILTLILSTRPGIRAAAQTMRTVMEKQQNLVPTLQEVATETDSETECEKP